MKNKYLVALLIPFCVPLFSCGDNTIDTSDCYGLVIEKEKTTYEKGETVTLDDLKVFAVNEEGNRKIEIEEYNVSFYQDNNLVSDISLVNAGRYQLWVEANINNGNYLASTFEFIYVNASLKTFKVDTTTGVFTQKAGDDVMSQTWRFILTYQNGSERHLSIDSAGMSYEKLNFITNTKGVHSFVVKYTEENNESRQCAVSYEITE